MSIEDSLENKVVCFFVHRFDFGGMEVSVLRMARTFIRFGWDVHLVVTDPKSSTGLDIEGQLSGLSVHPISLRGKNTLRHLLVQLKPSISFIIYDVITSIFLPLIYCYMGRIVQLLRNAHPDIYRVASLNLRYTNCAISNSKKAEIEFSNLNSIPVSFVPNAVDGMLFDQDRHYDHCCDLKLLYVGRVVNESKGVYDLVDLCRLLNKKSVSFNLTVLGDGTDLERLKRMFHEEHLNHDISFRGSVSRKRVVEELVQSHFLLLPSYYEGMPNVVLEALSVGAIPVVRNLPGITDQLFHNNAGGYLCRFDSWADDAACVVSSFWNKPGKFAEISRIARKHAEEHYTCELEYKGLVGAAVKSKAVVDRKPLVIWLNFSVSLITFWFHIAIGRTKRSLLRRLGS